MERRGLRNLLALDTTIWQNLFIFFPCSSACFLDSCLCCFPTAFEGNVIARPHGFSSRSSVLLCRVRSAPGGAMSLSHIRAEPPCRAGPGRAHEPNVPLPRLCLPPLIQSIPLHPSVWSRNKATDSTGCHWFNWVPLTQLGAMGHYYSLYRALKSAVIEGAVVWAQLYSLREQRKFLWLRAPSSVELCERAARPALFFSSSVLMDPLFHVKVSAAVVIVCVTFAARFVPWAK